SAPLNQKSPLARASIGCWAPALRCALGCCLASSSVQALRQLHAADALEVALDGCRLLALALGGGLFVELAGTQIGQQAEFLDGALEAAQCHIERLVFFDANRSHVFSESLTLPRICARCPGSCP